MGLICVSLTEKTLDSTVELANTLDCDLVEVRLDYLDRVSDISRLGDIRNSVMVTCMPEWEGGLFKGLEEERMKLLKSALEYADYVSVELKTEARFRDRLLTEAGQKGVKVVMAFHDFKSTPPRHEIVELIEKMEEACADIAKVAFAVKEPSEALDILKAQVTADVKIPVIALGMGEVGRVTRVVGPMLGGYLTFAAPSRDRRAVAGQYTLEEMKAVKELLWR